MRLHTEAGGLYVSGYGRYGPAYVQIELNEENVDRVDLDILGKRLAERVKFAMRKLRKEGVW